MGFFSAMKKSFSKSKLMKSATKLVRTGKLDKAVDEIYSLHMIDEEFRTIHQHFSVSKSDIADIIKDLMVSGLGVEVRGHYVPVSTVLLHDTFAYMLRVKQGKVERTKALFEISEYFQKGEIVFKPEREFH